jgi:alkyl hydroperoxide reductase subunit AhpF
VGGGYVGLELGSVYAALGSRVTLVEMTDRLMGGTDPDLVEPLHRRLDELFEDIRLETRVVGTEEREDEVTVRLENGDGSEETTFDWVLVAIGRRPNTEDLGLEEAGFIRVDGERRTSAREIFAITEQPWGPLSRQVRSEGLRPKRRQNEQRPCDPPGPRTPFPERRFGARVARYRAQAAIRRSFPEDSVCGPGR